MFVSDPTIRVDNARSRDDYMANETKDGWDKFSIITTVIGSLLLPIIIFIVSNNYTEQQKKADEERLAQQKAADVAQHNADRVAVLLTHLASNNPRERLLATRFVDYLVKNNLFPKELSLQDVLLDAVKDKDETVAHTASHVLTQAVTANPALKQSIEKAAGTDPEIKNTVIRAVEMSPELGQAIDIRSIRRMSTQ